jgi:hypothetical protein
VREVLHEQQGAYQHDYGERNFTGHKDIAQTAGYAAAGNLSSRFLERTIDVEAGTSEGGREPEYDAAEDQNEE